MTEETIRSEEATVDPVAELQKQLAEEKARAESYLDQWRRSAADFSNFKKRLERESSESQKYALAGFIKKLLPVVDDLDRAFEHLPAELKGAAWVQGVDLVRQKLMTVLAQEGVQAVGAEREVFDPSQHEAVTHEKNEDFDDGEIIAVIRKGYRMGERILRPAQVRVAKRD